MKYLRGYYPDKKILDTYIKELESMGVDYFDTLTYLYILPDQVLDLLESDSSLTIKETLKIYKLNKMGSFS